MKEKYIQLRFSVLLIILGSALFLASTPVKVSANSIIPYETDESSVTVNVWYGDSQTFGWPGNPQRQINILGNAINATTLEYSLNGGSLQVLSIGPDSRRLQNAGDFAIDIFDRDLIEGLNSVEIIANRNMSDEDRKVVSIQYSRTNFWPETYSVDWNSGNIQSKVQFVDGLWNINADGIRTSQIGYDRLIAIGDLGWRDYEITVPITIHSMDPAGYEPPSYGPAVGILMRWSGHTHDPVSCDQPDCGYQPYGAIGWYRWPYDLGPARLQIDMNSVPNSTDTSGKQLAFDTTYMFKMSVQTQDDGRSLYKLKVWNEGTSEPTSWDLQAYDGSDEDPTGGSILLLAHHVDATFGNVSIVPLSTAIDTNMVSDDFNRCELDNGIWEFSNPLADATMVINNGYTQDASLSISLPQGVEHILDRSTNTVPKVRQFINDGDFNLEVQFDSSILPTSDIYYPLQGIVLKNIDHTRWVQAELQYRLSGVYLVITTQEKTGSTSWLKIEWLMEKISENNQADITLALKRYGSRYLLSYRIMQNEWVDRITFPFHQKITESYIYAGNEGNTQAPQINSTVDYYIATNDPISVEDEARNELNVSIYGSGLVNKSPDRLNYSCGEVVTLSAFADENWVFSNWSGALEGSEATNTITMNSPSTVGANFSQTAFIVDINIVGSGDVTKSPEKTVYLAGETVVLTAVADPGWVFDHWEGVVVSEENELFITVTDEDLLMTAIFVPQLYALTIHTTGEGNVIVTPDKTYYAYGEIVTLQAEPALGWSFAQWEGSENGFLDEISFMMDSHKNVTAIFSESFFEITTSVIGSGWIEIEPNKTLYAYGELVNLQAYPQTGWIFSHWEGTETRFENPLQIQIENNNNLRAVFTQRRIYLPMLIK
ncbi:MAG: hypothetical protein CL609_08690 [Anaerolineaceae bacterium]|nr:hypothetical protein [Anaerolineaceae bacterium]